MVVTIVMPAYNSEKTIIESIDSIVNQTYKKWKLFVVNDCSTDSTKKIIESYATEHSNISLIDLEVNGGVANARNVALDLVDTKYVAFLDSDDRWTPDKLEAQVKYMEDNNLNFSYTNFFLIDDDSKLIGERIARDSVTFSNLLKTNDIGCLSVMITKNLLADHRMKSIGHEDYLFWLTLLSSGTEAHLLPIKLAYYRVGKNSLSSDKIKSMKWQWSIYRNELKFNAIKSFGYMILYGYYAIKKRSS